MSSEHDPLEDNRTTLILFIGRSELTDQWQRDFQTRNINMLNDLQAQQFQVRTYPSFNHQHARDLLTSSHYRRLELHVSLLELDHRQCASIMDGITLLEKAHPDEAEISIDLEYEYDNPEHDEAVKLAEAFAERHPFGQLNLNIGANFRIGAASLLPNEGDDGSSLEEDDDEAHLETE